MRYLILLLISVNLFGQADYESKRKPLKYKTTTGINEAEFNSRIDADDFAIPHKKWIVANIAGGTGDSTFVTITVDSIKAITDTIFFTDIVKFTDDQTSRFIDLTPATPTLTDTLIFLDNTDNDTARLTSISVLIGMALDSIHFRKVGDFVKLKDITDTLLFGVDTFAKLLRPVDQVLSFEHNSTMQIKSGLQVMPDATYGNSNIILVSAQPSGGTGHGLVTWAMLNNDGQPIEFAYMGADIVNTLVGLGTDSVPSVFITLGASTTGISDDDIEGTTIHDYTNDVGVNIPSGITMLNNFTPKGWHYVATGTQAKDANEDYANLSIYSGHSSTPGYKQDLIKFSHSESGQLWWKLDSNLQMQWYHPTLGTQDPLNGVGGRLELSNNNSNFNWTVNQMNVAGSNGSSFFNKFYSTNYTLKIISGDSSIVPLKHDVQLVIQNQLNASNTYGWLMNQNRGSVENSGIGFVNYGATTGDYKGGIGLVTRSTLTEKGIRLYVNALGNVIIGADTTDNGNLLQVKGSFNYFTGSLTDGTPTDAQIDGILGTPASNGAGFVARIKDTDGSGLIYEISTDGTNWYYITSTLAL